MPPGKYFFIRSQMNGLVLDVQGSEAEPGTKVFMWDQKGLGDADNQLFYEDHAHGCIRTKLDDDLCLEIDDDNTLVINRYDDGNDNQQWNIIGDRIANRGDPGRVLDVAQADEDERTRVCAWDWHGEENQLWELEHIDARYFFIKSEMNGLVVDIRGADDSAGAEVIMWEQGDGEDNQLWYEDRRGVLHSKMNDFVMDASRGDNIQMEEEDPGNDDQRWTIVGRCIINQGSRNVLDIRQACEDPGTNLMSYQYNGDDNQHFSVEYV